MTQEDKELLLKDLSARLLYGVKFNYCGYDGCDYKVEIITSTFINNFPIEDCKPYLRPMSSMTEEEKEELIKNFWGSHTAKDTFEELSWYLSKHFDINELIPRGLAIEVTEDNNPYKE